MSESAEPASEAVEVEESGERAQVVEEQQQQQPAVAEVEIEEKGETTDVEVEENGEAADIEVEENGKAANVEVQATSKAADDKCEEVVQEVGEVQQVKIQEQEVVEEQILEAKEVQRENKAEEQNDEEKQEQPLEDLQDTIQLPIIDTSQGAIEDEEMPSMVTLSSSSRMDESDINMKQEEERRVVEEESISQPNPVKDDDSDDSVCVIDDDDEDEDEEDDDDDDDDDDEDGEEREGEEIPFEEDEEGFSGSEDEGSEESDQHYTDDYERRLRREVQNMEEDEDEEEDEPEDEKDDSKYNSDNSDRRSDDVFHRHSNGLEKHSKERSASLQDLNLIEGYSPKKVNVNPFSQKARMERNQTSMDRRSTGKQYAHVESKVKRYIMDLSEQRRLSTERRKRAQEEARYRYRDVNDVQLHRNEEVVMACKTIKGYMEKGLSEVAECEEESKVYQLPQCLENGEVSIFPRRSVGNGEQLIRPDDDGMDIDPVDIETIRHEEKVDRINGTTITERKGIHRREDYSKPVINGDNPSSTVCDLRTLTYEEYMKGSIPKEVTEEIIEEDEEEVQEAPASAPYNDNATSSLRIDNVASIYHNEQQVDSSLHDRVTPPRMVNRATETLSLENPEVNMLKTQLQNRNTQFESLRDAYQKTVSENMAMKVELENLRKMVSYLQEQNKPSIDTKTTAIQTEASVPRSMPNIDIDAEIPADPRIGTTSMISAMSSQWTDSIGSALTSMEPPPNVTNALNSDESNSQTGKTPLKQKNPFSRAFMTSSRILQTLSNITHGRSKQSRQSKERARKLSATEKEPVAEVGPSNPKKRKATDTLEISSSAQPFKIPHKEHQHPANAEEAETVDLDGDDAESGAAENDNASGFDPQEMVINNEDVKVFVYPEDEHGQEHSFLIQAREISNNPKPGVRECGPYLLGNVEVYMTEMNGTINIWGKELNQSSATSQQADELETSARSKDLKSGLRWQSTPRIFNEGSASTSKKSRVVPRFTQQQKQHLCEVNSMAVDYSCQSHGQRLSWPSCSHESQHACCPAMRADELHCGCGNHRSATGSCCRLNRFVDPRRFSMNDVHQTHSPLCCHGGCQTHNRSPAQPEPFISHQPFVRRHSFEPTDEEENAEDSVDEENDQYTSKGQSNEDSSAHSCSKLAPPSSTNRRGSGDNSDGSMFVNDGDPLLGQRQTPDAPENSKRRLRGKKVRGLLMDLLKGCGDCRTSNPVNKTNLQHSASIYAPSTSTQQKIACPPNQPSCSLRSNDKCSSCRTGGTDKTVEFEAQLEYFRSQMDKLRSHSDNLREMLDTIRKDNPN